MGYWRWKYFKPKEVLSPDGIKLYQKGHMKVQEHALDILTDLRIYIGEPFYINHGWLSRRGYRSERENKETRGATYSYHLQGIAFDITVDGMKAPEFFEKVKFVARSMGIGGIGLYTHSNFVHVDMRPLTQDEPEVWKGN